MIKLACTVAATLALLAPGSSIAQHPPTAVVGNGLSVTDTAAICRHVRVAYPFNHAIVEAPGLSLDCDRGNPQVPIHISYASISDLMWLASRPGHLMPD